MILVTVTFLSISFSACAYESDVQELTLVQSSSIHIEEDDSLFIGDFSSIDVWADPFRMYIPDENVHRIAVVNSTGNILRVFGSEGQGPGELYRPMAVVSVGDRVYVKESNRFSVFDTTGIFLETLRLPEGIYPEDRWSLSYFEDRLYIGAAAAAQVTTGSARATAEQNTVVAIDTSFSDAAMFGSYPDLYTQGEYNDKWRNLDISSAGLLLAVYPLTPIIQVYDVQQSGRPLLRTVEIEHPAYRPVREELPIQTSIQEMQRIAVETSTVLSVWALHDSLAMLVFANRSDDYYDRIGDDTAVQFFGVVVSTSGEQMGGVDLPGPVLGRDDLGRLYIRLSNIPDEREIGVFEVRVD